MRHALLFTGRSRFTTCETAEAATHSSLSSGDAPERNGFLVERLRDRGCARVFDLLYIVEMLIDVNVT